MMSKLSSFVMTVIAISVTPAWAQMPVGMFADVEGHCVVQDLQDQDCEIGKTLASAQIIELQAGAAATVVLNSGETFELTGASTVEVFGDGVFVISGELPRQIAEQWQSAPALIAASQRFEVGAVRMRGLSEGPVDEPLPPAPDEDARFSSRLMYAMTLLRHGEDEEAYARLRLLLEERPDSEFIRGVIAGGG